MTWYNRDDRDDEADGMKMTVMILKTMTMNDDNNAGKNSGDDNGSDDSNAATTTAATTGECHNEFCILCHNFRYLLVLFRKSGLEKCDKCDGIEGRW